MENVYDTVGWQWLLSFHRTTTIDFMFESISERILILLYNQISFNINIKIVFQCVSLCVAV